MAETARITLIIGKDEFAANREAARVYAQVCKIDPAAVRYDIRADDEFAHNAISDSLSPSLFGEPNVLVISMLNEATDEVAELLEKICPALPDEVWLIGLHPGGVKGKRLLDQLRKAGATEIKADPPKPEVIMAELKASFKKHKKAIDDDALDFLHTAVGNSLGALHAAVSQLCNDVEDPAITLAAVKQFYNGVGEIDLWDLGSTMWEAKPLELLHKFRWALELDSGASVVSVIAMTNTLRTLVAFAKAPEGLRDGELASICKVPPSRIKDLRRYKRMWTPQQLEQAVVLLAAADRASKGTKYVAGVPGGASLDKLQSAYLMEQDFLQIRPIRSDA